MSTSNKSARLTAHDQLMFCADGLLDHYSLLPPPHMRKRHTVKQHAVHSDTCWHWLLLL